MNQSGSTVGTYSDTLKSQIIIKLNRLKQKLSIGTI